MPGFCRPVFQTMPDWDSAIRGGAAPGRGSTVIVRVTTPPSLRTSTNPDSSRPVPAQPEAISTGVGRIRPAEVDGERTPLRAHASTAPAAGSTGPAVSALVAAAGQRSQSTRAGLNTGPSTHARA